MNGLYEFSCGSIPDRGVHYGKKYMRKWLDSYDGKKFFVLKMDVHHFFESINRRILKRKLKEVIRDKRFYRLLCILIEHDKIALVAKILTDAGVEIDAEQTKTLVGCIAFDDISGALEYVVMPNQLGIDAFDLDDAFTMQENHMCSSDMREFIANNHLNLSMDGTLNPREAFGSHDDADHVYNTPRAWYMLRCLNPQHYNWDQPDVEFTPESDDLPWTLVTGADFGPYACLKYVLSSHYQEHLIHMQRCSPLAACFHSSVSTAVILLRVCFKQYPKPGDLDIIVPKPTQSLRLMTDGRMDMAAAGSRIRSILDLRCALIMQELLFQGMLPP